MNDLYDLLRNGDPVKSEGLPEPSRLEEVLRRLHAGTPGAHSRRRAPWSAAASVMTVLGVCVAGAILLWTRGERTAVPTPRAESRVGPTPGAASHTPRLASADAVAVRHLQFATPEGVRVFWTFDPDFPED